MEKLELHDLTKDMDDYPRHMVCTITGDLMHNPVFKVIDGHKYTYEKVAIDTWLTTPNGDKNPLTMKEMPEGRETRFEPDIELKEAIIKYRKDRKIEEKEPEKPKIEPFSDFQQIQDDEREAIRLHRELNPNDSGRYNYALDLLDLVDSIFPGVYQVQSNSDNSELDSMPELESDSDSEMPELVAGDINIIEPHPELDETPNDIILNQFSNIINSNYNRPLNIIEYYNFSDNILNYNIDSNINTN